MAKKIDTSRWINVSVVGLSGTEKEKGPMGVGKSCLCNRFMRILEDDYNVEHISVLSQSDFSGRVVNNDHFLYWGDVKKKSEDGIDFTFQVIEQTEFIDDSSFQPFKGRKMEPYIKRCVSTQITSAEKLMYICKNQLGIEKEYKQKVLPDGKFNVDGFICVFDVSIVPSRTIEKQLEVVSNILINVIKTKKPVVLVTTKNDELNAAYVREVEKLLMRKEFKGLVPIVETSAHKNINVDTAFIVLANLIDRFKGRTKIIPYLESVRLRKEVLNNTTVAYQTLIQSQVTDYRTLWSQISKKISLCDAYINYKKTFGSDKAQRIFRRHVKMLKDEQVSKKVQSYLEMLPDILQELVPESSTLKDSDWPTVKICIQNHPDFNHYFYKCPDDIPWTECELDMIKDFNNEKRIPCDILETGEAESAFRNHTNHLQLEKNRQGWKKQFKQLLDSTGYVTPGTPMSEVKVLFMGHECFEALSQEDCQYIYDIHQKTIIENAKHNFQELLLEHANLFYHFKSLAPSGTITQEDIREIINTLKLDSRYKALERLSQDRKLMLFQHLGFVHCPIREHCPASNNCMDSLIEKLFDNRVQRPTSCTNQKWMIKSDNKLNLIILGCNYVAKEFCIHLKAQCDNNIYEVDDQKYKLTYRLIDGDVNILQNSFQTPDFKPNGCIFIYSNLESFEYIRDSLEKTLLSNLEKDDKLPFQGLPIILLYMHKTGVEQNDTTLQKDGQCLANSLQCPFIDIHLEIDNSTFNMNLISDAMKLLIECITHRIGFSNEYQLIMDPSNPDMRIIFCMFCDDPLSMDNLLSPFLNHECCYLSGERSIILETILGGLKRKVEIIFSSYHGANAFREELIHGFILTYYVNRKASLATLNGFSCNSFSKNNPNLPIQIIAITEPVETNSFFNDISQQFLNDGSIIANRFNSQFITITNSTIQKGSFYTNFFNDVWEKKTEIEHAFLLDELPRSNNRSSNNLCRLPSNEENPSDESNIFSPTEMPYTTNNNLDKQVFEIFPQSITPPEPAPPDYMGAMKKNSQMIASNSSIDELTSISESRESLTHDTAWTSDLIFINNAQNDSLWINNYSKHAFTTGRHHNKSRFENSNRTMKQPGKLNMNDYTFVTDAITRMNLISGKEYNCAPLATPENVDISSEYSQVKDVILGHPNYPFDRDYAYTMVEENVTTSSKLRQKEKKNYSDSDSDVKQINSSNNVYFSKLSHRPSTQKRSKKKKTGIPVSTPKIPSFNPCLNGSNMSFYSEDTNSEILNDSSTDNSDDKSNVHSSIRLIEKKPLRYKRKSAAPKPVPLYNFDEESSVDISSPRLLNSPSTIGNLKEIDDKSVRRKHKQISKEELKLEKKRLKAEKLKKKTKKKTVKSDVSLITHQYLLKDFIPSEKNVIPLLLEKCVTFIEFEGLNSEGLYRVPGNRSHVEFLFQKFEEDNNININNLHIPVNAVATALKDFLSKKLPPLFTDDLINELEELCIITDRNCRLMSLKDLLKKLPNVNFEILKFIFGHFAKVAENCKSNNMDSKNLAICWWPTLLPIEFNDMDKFEQLRPHLEDTVQTMIDQQPFLFCGQEAYVMV